MIHDVRHDAASLPADSDPGLLERGKDFVRSEGRWLVNMSSWLFILLSGGLLGWVTTMMMVQPEQEIRLFSLDLGTSVQGPWGLSYLGMPGLLLALFQLSLVSTGAIFSLIPSQRIRRTGHVVLVAWAGLWFGNLLHFSVVGGEGAALSTVVMGIFLSSVGARAVMDWNRPSLRGRDLLPSYGERVTQLSEYAQNLFAVDDVAKEADRDRRAREGAPWQRGWRRMRELPWSRWMHRSTDAVKRGAAASGSLVSRTWRRMRDGRNTPDMTA